MARSLGVITQTQDSDELFGKLCTQIKGIGVQTLARFELVSDVTIYKYMKGEACAPGVEESILDSIDSFLKERADIETINKNRAEALLASL